MCLCLGNHSTALREKPPVKSYYSAALREAPPVIWGERGGDGGSPGAKGAARPGQRGSSPGAARVPFVLRLWGELNHPETQQSTAELGPLLALPAPRGGTAPGPPSSSAGYGPPWALSTPPGSPRWNPSKSGANPRAKPLTASQERSSEGLPM